MSIERLQRALSQILSQKHKAIVTVEFVPKKCKRTVKKCK